MNKKLLYDMLQIGGEFVIGASLHVINENVLMPKCKNKEEKIIVTLAMLAASWYAGRKFHKEFEEMINDAEEGGIKVEIEN